MERRVDVRRFRIGLRGLALLRGWPLDEDRRAVEQMEAIRTILDEAPEPRELGDPGLSEAYERWATTYDDLPNLLIEAEEPLVRSMLDDVGGELALDAACGTGRLTRVLMERGYDVIGVDASAPMLQRAGSRPSARVAIGALERLRVGRRRRLRVGIDPSADAR